MGIERVGFAVTPRAAAPRPPSIYYPVLPVSIIFYKYYICSFLYYICKMQKFWVLLFILKKHFKIWTKIVHWMRMVWDIACWVMKLQTALWLIRAWKIKIIYYTYYIYPKMKPISQKLRFYGFNIFQPFSRLSLNIFC